MQSSILLSTAYLPPVSWIKEALHAKSVLIEAYETYPKQSYRNRCRIGTANGIQSLSIPVNKPNGKNTITKDIEIFYGEPWQRLHWRSIHAAYSNSPYYLYYQDELIQFYEKKYRFLIDFNLEILNATLNMMKLPLEIDLTKEFNHHPSDTMDLRNSFSPKNPIDPQEFTTYHQVFEDRHGFMADLSVVDLLFNEGPAAQSALNME